MYIDWKKVTKFHIPNFCAFFWGDWGGILSGSEPLTFKNRPQVVEPIDSHAQSYVARKMAQVADEKRPKFVINVGDVVEIFWEKCWDSTDSPSGKHTKNYGKIHLF